MTVPSPIGRYDYRFEDKTSSKFEVAVGIFRVKGRCVAFDVALVVPLQVVEHYFLFRLSFILLHSATHDSLRRRIVADDHFFS
jgi:hypothetical protein